MHEQVQSFLKKQQETANKENEEKINKIVSALKCRNFDLQTELGKEQQEVAELQQKIKDQLCSQSKPPRPKSFPMNTPRAKSASNDRQAPSVPKLELPEQGEPIDDQNYYGELDEYGNPEKEEDYDYEEDWEEEEQEEDWFQKPEQAEEAEARPARADHRKTLPVNALGQKPINPKWDPNFVKNDDWIDFDKQPHPSQLKVCRKSGGHRPR